jgi:flagellar biosynthesis anti-sigma factor FlgM
MVQGPNDLPNLFKAPAVQPAQAPRPAAAGPKAPAPQAVSQPADSVQISPRASQAAQLQAQLDAVPEVRVDRVEEVKAKLASIVQDSSSLNAKLAEKLLTEN